VLFGVGMERDYPQCALRMARFKGVDKPEFLDNRQIHGHALHLLEEAMPFMMRHLPIAGRFEPNRLERIDELLFPVAALREAVINALCHRKYTHPGGSVDLAIYDYRLEIWSDGTLPFGLKPEDLKWKHASRPRNLLIAGVFYRRGLIERWGRGIEKTVELCTRGRAFRTRVRRAGGLGPGAVHAQRLRPPIASRTIYVTAFPDRGVMGRYLSEISWETEVWCADAPSHLIHFDGERFLGPHERD